MFQEFLHRNVQVIIPSDEDVFVQCDDGVTGLGIPARISFLNSYPTTDTIHKKKTARQSQLHEIGRRLLSLPRAISLFSPKFSL